MHDEHTPSEATSPSGLGRRDFVKRAAAAGALAWTAPSITSATAAFATTGGSEICEPIDPFTTPQELIANAGAGAVTGQVADAAVLGGFRDASLEAYDLGVFVDREAVLTIQDGMAQVAQPTGVGSTAILTFDGANVAPPVDTTGFDEDLVGAGFDRFRLNLTIDQALTTVTVAITVWDHLGGSDTVSIGLSVDVANGFALYDAPFANFSGVDFTRVGAVRLRIEAPAAVDYVAAGLRMCRLGA